MFPSNEITEQNVQDIVITALEGGINYWADFADVSLIDMHYPLPFTITVEGKNFVLTDVSIRFGIEKEANRRGRAIWEFLENHDADDADCVVQWALFNDLVYG